MLNNLKTFFILLSISSSAFSQTAFESLDENNTRITISNGGDFFSVRAPKTNYEVPKSVNESDIGKSTIFAGSVWVGALDDSNQIHIAAMHYGQNGQDFQPGPSSKLGVNAKYDKIWKVNKNEIINHIANPSSPIVAILTWPGNGDTTIGEPLQLAPYEDVNLNGIYEPTLGDYPKIKGEVATYCIYNDNKGHTETGGESLNIDVHQLFFQEEAGAYNSILDHNNLAWFKIVNRSKTNYHNLKVGFFIDYDLGYFSDDYLGCDTTLDLMYAYNGDDYDEGTTGYGYRAPAQGLKFLNHKMSSFVYFDNNRIDINGNPSIPADFYNYLNGRWKDSSTIYYINPSNLDTVISPYMFSGNPVNNDGWTESNYGNSPADRRGIASVGPFTLAPNEAICIDVAFVYGKAAVGDNLSSITVMKDIASRTQFAYNQDYNSWKSYGCESNETLGTPKIEKQLFTVYPNPSFGQFYFDKLPNSISTIINATGQTIKVVEPNSTQIDLTEMASGVYFLKTEVGSLRLLKL